MVSMMTVQIIHSSLHSPLIGPRYYDWDAENEWFYDKADGHLLVELLVRELMHITSVCVNL